MALAAGMGAAHACPGLDVRDAWVREAPPGADVMAAYATLENRGARPLEIDGVGGADFAAAALHETVLKDGVAHMAHGRPIRLLPQRSVRLEPGGMHIMLFQPRRALKVGDRATLSLQCVASRRSFDFVVKTGQE
jgi:copper(I)-binding protein